MKIDDIQAHPLYKLLNQRQQRFLDLYLTNGYNAPVAARTAYSTTTESASRKFAKRCISDDKIIELLAIWNGQGNYEPTLPEFRQIVLNEYRRSEASGNRFNLLELYAVLRGWKRLDSAPPPDPQDILKIIESRQ